jgi:hypothetical protein
MAAARLTQVTSHEVPHECYIYSSCLRYILLGYNLIWHKFQVKNDFKRGRRFRSPISQKRV